MKWRYESPKPEIGAARRRTVFAWLPRRCDDGMTRWLERVVRVEVFRETGDPGPGPYPSSPGPLSVGWFRSHYEAPGGVYIHFSGPSPPPLSDDFGKKS